MKTFLIILICFVAGAVYSQTQNEELKKVNELHSKANSFFLTNLDSAKHYAHKALDAVKLTNNVEQKARIYITLSNIYHRDNQIDKAFEYIDLSGILNGETNNPEVEARFNFQKGSLLFVIGNHDQAVDHLNKAINVFSSLNDSSSLAVSYNLQSSIYAHHGNVSKAIATIQKAIQINESLGKKHSLGISLGNLALYHMDNLDRVNAMKQMRKTLPIFKELKSYPEYAQSLTAMAELFIQDEKFDSALVYLKQATRLTQEQNLQLARVNLWNTQGDYHFQLKNNELSLAFYKKAYTLSHDLGIAETKLGALNGMYKSAKTLQRSSLALHYLEILKSLSDSLEVLSGKQALSALELNKNFEQQHQLSLARNKELEIKKRNSELLTERKNYIILMMVIASSFIIALGVFLIRKKQKTIFNKVKEQLLLNEELELRNKELVSSAIQVLRKSEEMKKAISSLQELSLKSSIDDRAVLQAIIRKLKFELEHNSWEEFEVPFKQLHSSFYDKLVEKYPDLTRAEIKVCSLLKLNLDTKQISSILHKTSASIEVDRSRIRKKMGLTNSKTSLTRHILTNI